MTITKESIYKNIEKLTADKKIISDWEYAYRLQEIFLAELKCSYEQGDMKEVERFIQNLTFTTFKV